MEAPSELKLYSIWLSFSKKHSYYTSFECELLNSVSKKNWETFKTLYTAICTKKSIGFSQTYFSLLVNIKNNLFSMFQLVAIADNLLDR